MPVGQKTRSMNLLGTSLLSLALFGLCCIHGVCWLFVSSSSEATYILREDAQEGEDPKLTSSSSPTTGSTTSESSTVTTGNTLKSDPTNSSVPVSVTTQRTQDTATLSTSKSTVIINGTTESSAQLSVTTASSNLTLSKPDPGITTTTNLINKNVSQELVPKNTSEPTTKDGTGGGYAADRNKHSYSDIILPVIIALIVISLSMFLLVALYRMCLKTPPERQENGTEQTPSDKENVKLISVKTTSPEAGEQASQGKNKARQHNDSSTHLSSKCV